MSTKLIRAYSSGIVLYGIDEYKQRYENYFPLEYDCVKVKDASCNVCMSKSKEAIFNEKLEKFSDDEYWKNVRMDMIKNRTEKEHNLMSRYNKGEYISMDEGFNLVYNLMRKEQYAIAETMGYKVGSYIKDLNENIYYIINVSFSDNVVSPENAVFYIYPVKDLEEFDPEVIENFNTLKGIRYIHSIKKDIRCLNNTSDRYEYYLSMDDKRSFEIGDEGFTLSMFFDLE